MGGKSPDPPPVPDPFDVAQADAQANRINQFTPFGNLIFSGPFRNNAQLTFSPLIQGLFDQRLGLDSELLSQGLARLSQFNQNPIDLSGLPELQSSVDTSDINLQNVDLSGIPTLDPSAFGLGPGQLPEFQRNVDFSGLPEIPQNIEQFRGDVEDAFFRRSRRLLDPVINQQERNLRQTLANQGLPTTGEAFGTEFDLFNRQRSRTFQDIADQSILLGGQEASRQLANILGARGQGVNERLAQAGFGNQAAAQQLAAALSGFGAQATANQDAIGRLLGEAGFNNQTALQNFGIGQQQLANNNAARTQALNEALGIRGNQFNEFASLLGLQQVGTPQLGSFFAPGGVNTLGAFQLAQNQANQNFQAESARANAALGGLFSLGSAALLGPFAGGFGGGATATGGGFK